MMCWYSAQSDYKLGEGEHLAADNIFERIQAICREFRHQKETFDDQKALTTESGADHETVPVAVSPALGRQQRPHRPASIYRLTLASVCIGVRD